MSSFLVLERTVFQNVDQSGHITGSTFGYRLYDDNERYYTNTIDSLDALLKMTPHELIEHAHTFDQEMAVMIGVHKQFGDPIFVDGDPVL